MGTRVATTLGHVVFTSLVTSLGTAALASHTIAITAEQAFYIPGYGMQAAASTLAGQSLGEVLSLLDIKSVYVVGIATEYCVKNTAEDLLKAGFKVNVLTDCLGYVDHQGHLDTLPVLESEGIRLL
jgi:nicotinamidase-related amidase